MTLADLTIFVVWWFDWGFIVGDTTRLWRLCRGTGKICYLHWYVTGTP